MQNRIVAELMAAGRLQDRMGAEEAEGTSPPAGSHDQGIWRSAERWMEEYPATCLAAALVVGLGLGWWIKRGR